MPEFQERLRKVDDELKRKLKETPLRRTEGGAPHVSRGFGTRPLGRGRPSVKPEARKEAPPPPPREREVDIFDEQDHVLVVAEVPGVKEESIDVKLEKDKLSISAEKGDKKYHKELILPCAPTGELNKTYKNGVLEVTIKK